MVEGNGNPDPNLSTEGGGEGNYYDSMEMIKGNKEALEFAQKYKSAEEAILGGHNAEAKIGSSFRLPADTTNLTDEQKGELLGYIKQFRNVPETAEGYEITHAEGVEVNKDFESAFRAFAHERGWDSKDVQQLVDWWDGSIGSMNEKRQQDDEKAAIRAEQDFRIKKGANYDIAMENIKRLRMMHATELGLTYQIENDVDEKGNSIIHSKLDDALNAKDVNGRLLGNHPVILQWLDHIWEKYEADGQPVLASGGVEGGGAGAALSKEFYAKKTE